MKLWLVVACCLLSACSLMQQDNDSLYQDLGELPGITNVVDSFLQALSDDHRVVEHFLETDPERFREKLIEQICEVSGGPCEYTGKSMADIHAGMEINAADFNFVVEDLQKAMNEQGVPLGVQNRLLARLAPMRSDIIYR